MTAGVDVFLLALRILKELEEGYDYLIENQSNAMDIAHHANIEKAKISTLKNYVLEMDKERTK